MKKITMVVMIVSIILAFMPINQVVAAESASIGLAIDVVKGVFEIAKTIKGSNTNQDVNLGKEIEVYQVNSKNVLVSDGSYKKNPCIFFTVQDNESKFLYHVGFEKNNTEDMQIVSDFNKMDVPNKKKFIKDAFLKYAKYDLGKMEGNEVNIK